MNVDPEGSMQPDDGEEPDELDELAATANEALDIILSRADGWVLYYYTTDGAGRDDPGYLTLSPREVEYITALGLKLHAEDRDRGFTEPDDE